MGLRIRILAWLLLKRGKLLDLKFKELNDYHEL